MDHRRGVEVTLKNLNINNKDDIAERTFVVRSDRPRMIGRASKNDTKGIVARPTNAWLDNQVVSRDQAQLTVDVRPGLVQRLFIQDFNSMHGTLVNGNQIKGQGRYLLASGDTLQFGSEINRGDETFRPSLFTIVFHHATGPLPASAVRDTSGSFSVPYVSDDDAGWASSEAADVESTPSTPDYMEHYMPKPPRGTQNDPLEISDDTDFGLRRGSHQNPVEIADDEDVVPETVLKSPTSKKSMSFGVPSDMDESGDESEDESKDTKTGSAPTELGGGWSEAESPPDMDQASESSLQSEPASEELSIAGLPRSTNVADVMMPSFKPRSTVDDHFSLSVPPFAWDKDANWPESNFVSGGWAESSFLWGERDECSSAKAKETGDGDTMQAKNRGSDKSTASNDDGAPPKAVDVQPATSFGSGAIKVMAVNDLLNDEAALNKVLEPESATIASSSTGMPADSTSAGQDQPAVDTANDKQAGREPTSNVKSSEEQAKEVLGADKKDPPTFKHVKATLEKLRERLRSEMKTHQRRPCEAETATPSIRIGSKRKAKLAFADDDDEPRPQNVVVGATNECTGLPTPSTAGQATTGAEAGSDAEVTVSKARVSQPRRKKTKLGETASAVGWMVVGGLATFGTLAFLPESWAQ